MEGLWSWLAAAGWWPLAGKESCWWLVVAEGLRLSVGEGAWLVAVKGLGLSAEEW